MESSKDRKFETTDRKTSWISMLYKEKVDKEFVKQLDYNLIGTKRNNFAYIKLSKMICAQS